MEQAIWQTEPGGVLTSHLGKHRLVVERVNGWVRYQVFQRGCVTDVGGLVLLVSGNQDDVRTAMDAAEQVAKRADAGRRWPAAEQTA